MKVLVSARFGRKQITAYTEMWKLKAIPLFPHETSQSYFARILYGPLIRAERTHGTNAEGPSIAVENTLEY